VVDTYYVTAGDAMGVAISGTHAFVAAGWGGLIVVDVSNPEEPTRAGLCTTPGYAQDLWIEGPHVYVADGSHLSIVDASDVENPEVVGEYGGAGDAKDVALWGNQAYLASGLGGLHSVDVSDPRSPDGIGVHEVLGIVPEVDVAGHYAYAATGEWRGLSVVDTSDPVNPLEVETYSAVRSMLDLEVREDYLYAATGAWGGLRILDISDPLDVEQAGIRRLVESGQQLSSQVLVLPHHGSRSSLSPELYEAVDPDCALVSCGSLNVFHFPHRQVQTALQERDVPLFSTAELGSVSVRWEDERMEVEAVHGGTVREGHEDADALTGSNTQGQCMRQEGKEEG